MDLDLMLVMVLVEVVHVILTQKALVVDQECLSSILAQGIESRSVTYLFS